jgi:hypothetical protein
VHGRGVSDALVSWTRKIEYDYWTARLSESFRFESVRSIAQRRLETAKRFMEQLEIENKASDLEDILLEQKLQSPMVVSPRQGEQPNRAVEPHRRFAKTTSHS